MLFNILMWASIFWIAPLLGYIMTNNAKFKKNIAVGVTFMEEGKQDAEVIARLNRYKKQVKMITIVLLLALIPGVFVSRFWILLTYYLVWTYVTMFIYAIPFYLCNKDLKAIKKRRGWVQHQGEKVEIDMENIPNFKEISPLLFIIPCIVSLLPLIWDRTFYVLYITSAASVLVFWFSYRYFYRNRSEKVNEEKDLTRVLTQIRHYNWSKIWIVASWMTIPLSFSGLLFISHPALALTLIFLVTAVICVEAVSIEVKLRKMQEKLTRGSGVGAIVDEDDKWIGGMIYYNPNDSRLIVNERVGMNTTLNLARTSGKVITLFFLILLLALPFTGPAMNVYYKQPIKIEVTKDEVEASQGITNYRIKLSDIKNVELIDELSDDLVRVNGTSFDDLLKGDFRDGNENLVLLLRPESKPFIRITDKNGKVFVFSFRGDVKGKFEEIRQSLK